MTFAWGRCIEHPKRKVRAPSLVFCARCLDAQIKRMERKYGKHIAQAMRDMAK